MLTRKKWISFKRHPLQHFEVLQKSLYCQVVVSLWFPQYSITHKRKRQYKVQHIHPRPHQAVSKQQKFLDKKQRQLKRFQKSIEKQQAIRKSICQTLKSSNLLMEILSYRREFNHLPLYNMCQRIPWQLLILLFF